MSYQRYQIKSNRIKSNVQDLKKQTALRLAQEQTTESSTQQVGNVGQFPPHRNNNHAYSATIPTGSYPQQNNPLQQEQNQQQHATTTTNNNNNNRKSTIYTSADHEQRQLQHQLSGYLGAPSYDLNYMQPHNQNIIPAGPPADIHLLVSYDVPH